MNRYELHRRVEDLLDLRRHAEAEQLVRQHLLGEPEDTAALVLLATALKKQERRREAEDVVRAAIRLAPEDLQAFIVLCDLLVARDDQEEALAAADQVLRLDPTGWTGHYVRARALLVGRRPRTRDALDEALRAVAAAPHNPSAHNLVGICFDSLNDRDRARQAWQETLRLDPQHVNAQANLAALDVETGRLRRGAQRVTAALGQHPQEQNLHGTLDAVVGGFAVRLLWVVLAGAALIGILLGTGAPYPARATAGITVAVAVAVLVRWFFSHLPRGVRPLSALGRARRGPVGWGVPVLVLAATAVAAMALAPYDVAVVAGKALVVVLRGILVVAVLGFLVRALQSLRKGD